MSDRPQTVIEEVFNSITCGVGACLSLVGLVVLVVLAALAGDPWRIVSMSVYGASLVLLFLSSTLYHALPDKEAKHIFEILDHCMIYVLIAGTYTPFALVTLNGAWGWSIFGTVWGLALLGIAFKIFFINRFRLLSLVVYLLMGWLIVVALHPLMQNLAPAGIAWMLAGGLIYSSGVIFYRWHKLPFHHTIWHGFVLMGAFCHYVVVYRYVLNG